VKCGVLPRSLGGSIPIPHSDHIAKAALHATAESEFGISVTSRGLITIHKPVYNLGKEAGAFAIQMIVIKEIGIR